MKLPAIPPPVVLAPLPHVSASEATRLLACPLRVVFDRNAVLRRLQPYTAGAMIGTAAHAVLAALTRAQSARIASEHEQAMRLVARNAFDDALALECRGRDAAIAQRGELPGDSTERYADLPFYSMTRARLARFAEQRFGHVWRWQKPRFTRSRRSTAHAEAPLNVPHEVEAELMVRSRDGLVLGIADAVDLSAGEPVVEEFKTGESNPERLATWKHQLLIYAHLFSEQFGHAPARLRVHSLASGTHEFACDKDEAAEAVQRTRSALLDLNRAIAAGAPPSDLARPSQATCPQCPHRPWCQSYWLAGAPGSTGSDVAGTVTSADGWEADVAVSPARTVRANFRALRVAPEPGMYLRICGALVGADGSLRCTRGTSVWSSRA